MKTKIIDKITIRTCEEKDEASLAVLLHNNFPNAALPAAINKMWRWQFRNGFSKNGGVAVAQIEDGIVAQYAVMWLQMIYKGHQMDGAISTATVTDESVRGQGLFTKLAAKVYMDIAKEGAKIVFGFPNSLSVNGFVRRLEWFEVAPFPLYIKPVDATPLIRKVVGASSASRILGKVGNVLLRLIAGALQILHRQENITFKKVNDIPDALDKLWETTFIARKIALIRNKQYLKWRYMEKPFFAYDIYVAMVGDEKLCGCVITHTAEKFGMKVMFVMELFAGNDEPSVCQALLHNLNKMAVKQGADAISLLVLPGNPNRSLYLKGGYLPVPRRLFPQDIFFCAKVNSPDIDLAYTRNKENWYISWGDLDVV